MTKIFYLIAVFVVLLQCSVFSQDIRLTRFRSGIVYSAEITTAAPPIPPNESAIVFAPFEKPAWAEIIVKFDKGRSFSIYDFRLALIGEKKEYHCFSIAEGDEPYLSPTGADWILKNLDPDKFYRLLFYVEEPNPAVLFNPEMVLRFALFTSSPNPKLVFRNMGSAPFTPASKVPETGLLNLDAKELKAFLLSQPVPAAPAVEKIEETPAPANTTEETPANDGETTETTETPAS